MLARPPTTLSAPAKFLTGRAIAHSHKWSEPERANLAACTTFGAVVVAPLTAIQAAEVFSVPLHLVAAELKRLGQSRPRANGHTNGNGHAAPPTWDSLSSEQRAEFLKANFDAIFNELELRTIA